MLTWYISAWICIDITGITTNATTGVTTTILSKPVDEFESALAQVHVLDNVSNEQNYVEVYLDHNGTEAFISEFFFDSENTYSMQILSDLLRQT